MNNKTKTRSLKVAIIAIALLLCFALAVGVTSALYQARRQATGTLNMDKGIVIDYKGFNKGDENIWQRETTTSFKLFEETNAQPGQEISVYPSGIRANVDSINFYARLKLEYIFYNVSNGVETKVDLPNPKSLIKTSNDFFASNWVPSTDGYYYFGENTTLNQFSKDNQNFENLFADGAKFIIEGANFEGETAGEGGGFVVNGTAINKIIVYLTLETLQGDADPAVEGWKISQSTDKTVDISTLPEDKTDITIDDIIDENNKNGEVTITGDPKQPLTITIGSKAFYGCSKLKLTLSNSENIVYQIATDAFTSGATIMYGIDNVSSKLINPSTSGHTTVGFDGKWQVSAPGLYLFLPSPITPITPTTSSYGDFQYTDDQGTWYFDLIDESGNKVDASTLSSTISRNGASTFGASTYANTDNYTAKLNKFIPKDGVTTVVIPKYLGISEDSNKFALTKIDRYNKSGSSYGAFQYCRGLTSITIPDSVTSIGISAFEECSGLTSITIPDSVTSIGRSAFNSCSKLTSINVDSKNTKYHSAGNCLIETASKTLITGCKNSVIPTDGSVTSIGEKAFVNCSSLTSIVIPNSVTSIGDYTFQNCSGLTSVTIGNSVTSIGEEAFSYCRGLTSITIGNSVTSIGIGAFYGCKGLTSITIPNSVTSIGGSAFVNCSSLTSITIPNSVTSIGGKAFVNCSSLTSMHIGAGIQEVSWLPDNVSKMTVTISEKNPYLATDSKAIFAKLNGKLSVSKYISTEATYNIPSALDGLSVTNIGHSAFFGCSGLTSIIIGNSVTSIEWEAFSGCSGLTSITIPDSVTSIGNGAFRDCSSLTSITIPDSVTSIGWGTFMQCSGLTSITIPESVTNIGNRAFYSCSGLTSIIIGNSVTSIGYQAFSYCSGLTSITIPDSVTSIGDYAFYGCSGLTSIIIGNSVTSIGWEAFKYCSNLTSIIIPNSVTSIGYQAFYYCSGLTSVTIGNGVTSIGWGAFSGCSGLTSVTIGNGVTSIGWGAFSGCSGLTSIVLPEGIKEIPLECFKGCTNLKSITIPSTCTTIGNSAFENCSNLTTVIWNISYDLGGVNATGPELSSYTGSQTSGLTMDDIIKSAPTNVESGFTFEGWTDGTNIYQPGDKITFSLANRRLTAVWLNYKISFNGNGGEGSIDSIIVAKGSSITLPSLNNYTKEGFVAVGWSTDKNATYARYLEGQSYTPTSNVTFYAVWKEPVTITFDVNGGTGNIPNVITGDRGQLKIPTETPTREGYKFLGWSWSSTATYASLAAGTNYTYYASNGTTLYAVWGAPTTITFNANGGTGSVPADIKVFDGDNFTIPSASLTREGYKFLGWSWSSTATYADYSVGSTSTYTYYASNGTTLYAVWGAPTTITFNANGGTGSVPADIKVFDGDNFTIPSASLTREGYKFLGWSWSSTATYASLTAGNTYYYSNDGTTLYAVWKEAFTITFDANGGTGSVPADIKVFDGDNFTIPSASLTREGYKFLGWSWSSTATYASLTAGTNYTYYSSNGTTLYAVWKEPTTINFDLDGGEGELPSPLTTYYGDTLTINTGKNFTKEGYKFAGWILIDERGNQQTTYGYNTTTTFYYNGSSYTLKAEWSEPQTITFYNDNTKSQSFTMTGFFDVDGITFPEGNELTKEGYILVGWNTSANSSYVNYSIGQKYSNFSGYTELYAVWKSESEGAKIIFNFSEVEGQENIIKIGYDSSFRISDVVGSIIENIRNASGQAIAGWTWTQGSSNVDEYNDNWIYFSNYQGQTKTLYPVWKNVLTINFDLNGGEGTLPESFEIWEIKSFDIPEVSLTKDGYMFAGWAWRSNSTYTDYRNGETNRTFHENNTYGSTTLYAIWKQPLTISFDANGGEGEVPKDIITYAEGRIDIPEVTLTRDGYVFLGWSFNKNPIWDGIEYSNGEEDRGYYQFSSKTLYAVWGNTVTYIFDLNGGTGTTPASISANYGENISVPSGTGLERAGYKFKGWSINPNSNNYNWSSGTSTARGISGTITMYAVWEVLTDQVYVGSLTQSEIDAVQALWNGHTSRSKLTDTSLLDSMYNKKLHSRFSILAYLNNTSLQYNTNENYYYGIGHGTRYFRLSTNSYTFEFENSLPTGWKLVNWRYEVKASGGVTIVNGRAQATIDYTYAGFENGLSEERLMIIFVLPNQPAEGESVSVSISGLPGNALEAALKGTGNKALNNLMLSGITVEIYNADGSIIWTGKPNDSNQGFVKYRFATGTYKIRIYTTNVNGVAFVDNDKRTEVTGMDISEITKGDGYSEFTINYTFAEGNPNLAIFFKMADVDIDKIMEVQAYKDFSGPRNIVGNWFKGVFANMGVAFTDMTADEIKYAGYCGMLIQEYFNRSICYLPSFSIYTADGKIIENCENMALIAGVEYTIKFTEEVKELLIAGNDTMSIKSVTDITYNAETETWDATFSVSESTMLMFLTADLDLSQYEELPAYDAATDYSRYLAM